MELTTKPAFNGQMDETPTETRYKQREAILLQRTGQHESVERFMRKYGNQRSRVTYLEALTSYFSWLRSEGVSLDPDALISDNLKCIFDSGPTNILTKRKHTDLLDRYVNGYLISEGLREATRAVRAAAIIQFYKRNDSPLFGDFDVSQEKPRTPTKALRTVIAREIF
jgi:hypothetical protein